MHINEMYNIGGYTFQYKYTDKLVYRLPNSLNEQNNHVAV